jgi:hypothetical protein
MNQKQKSAQGRKWKRYKMKSGATVLIRKPRIIEFGKPNLIELGPIVDVSMGGLQVQYIENKQRVSESKELAISMPEKGIVVEPVPFILVMDAAVSQMPGGKTIKKRCVEFGKLTDYQTYQLKSFIKDHTIEINTERRGNRERRQFDDPRYGETEYYDMYNRRINSERRK